jgi:hypothetical protein
MIVSASQVVDIYWQTDAGAPATGKALADLNYAFSLSGVVTSITPVLAEGATTGAWRRYTLTFTAPATVGQLILKMSPTAGVLAYDTIVDDVVLYSLDAIAALLSSPVIATLTSGGPSGDTQLRVVKNTYVPVSFTVRDAIGTAVDLSAYSNGRFAIKSKDQTTTTYSQTTGITMTAGGLVSIAIPEGSTFYAALTTGVDSVNLYWDFVADEAADTAKTRCLARGQLVLMRTEQ